MDRKSQGKKNLAAMISVRKRCFSCEECGLRESATNRVFGSGPINSPIMLIGEAPCQDEDETGRPFVGKAGKLLSKLLCFAGILRERCYITNICKCRPPRNRKPTEDESDSCLQILLSQITLINPKIIVAVGGVSCETLGVQSALKNAHGKSSYSAVLNREVFCTYHPAYAIYSPEALPAVEADFSGLGQYCVEHGVDSLPTVDVESYTIKWVSKNTDFVNSLSIKPGGFNFSDDLVVRIIDGFIAKCFRELYSGDLKRIDEMYRGMIIANLYVNPSRSTFVQTVVKRLERHLVVLSAYNSKTASKESVIRYLKGCGLIE